MLVAALARWRSASPPDEIGDRSARSERSGAGGLVPGLLAAGWVALAAVEICLLGLVSGTAVHESRLPGFARITLVASELAVAAPVVLVLLGPVAMWLDRRRSRRRDGRLLAGLWLLPPIAVSWVLLLLLAVSWGAFRTSGRFLDVDALQLWAANPVQMVQHVLQTEAWRLAWVLGLVTAGAILACTLLPRLLDAGPKRLARRLVLLAVVGVLASTVAAGAGQLWFSSHSRPLSDPDTGAVSSLGELYRAARDDRSGPLLHAVAAAYRHNRALRAAASPAGFRAIRRAQITMDQYLDSVDQAGTEHWNVIIMLLESLRPDQLVSFGGPRQVMPALDRLAAGGVVFSNAYCQANNSFAGDPCALSGQYPIRERGMHIYPENPAYPRLMIYDLLKAVGYRTAIISSQNEGWGGMINFLDTGTLDLVFHAETAAEDTYLESSDSAFAAWIEETKRAGKLDDRTTIDEAIRWIDEAAEQPFCFYLNLQSSHLPYRVPEGFERPFGPDEIDFDLAFGSYPRERTPVVKDLYADSLRYMDMQIARLLEHLERAQLLERTIIIASGDSGEAFYEHGFSAHANKIYNEVMRVPLIVHAPGITPGVSVAPAQHIDIPPTILGLLGLPPHPSFQGVDLLHPPPPNDRCLYLTVQLPGAQQFGIVRGDYKLIFDVMEQRSYLYDLAHDPGETRDLSGAMPELAATLQSRLHAWYESQASYYEDPIRLQREYPPILVE